MSLKNFKHGKEALFNRRSDMWVTKGIQKISPFYRKQTDAENNHDNYRLRDVIHWENINMIRKLLSV